MKTTEIPGRERWRWNDRLEVVQREVEGKPVVVLHDPQTEDYYQLGQDEFELARSFDRGRAIDEVLQVSPRAQAEGLDRTALAAFATQLAEAGLLLPDGPTVPSPTAPPAVSPALSRSWAARLLHLQVAAFDAERFFASTLRSVRPLLSRPALLAGALSVVLATIVTIAQAGALREAIQTLFAGLNLVALWAVLAAVVVLHELAHGYTCTHLGGRVSTLGFLLMYGKPCAYCDVSDSWLLPRTSRLWIMAAGSLLELVLWALATLVWRITAPETFAYRVALLTLTVCGLGTLFNFNPLIRLDGYYMLSDVLEIPNLRQRAFADLGNRLLGRASAATTRRERRVFLAYGFVAVVYSALLVGVLLLALHRGVAARWGVTGLVVLWTGVAVVVARPFGTMLREGAAMIGARRRRRIVAVAVLVAVTALLVFVRWPLKVGADCFVEPRARVVVRSPVDGTIERVHAAEGDLVNADALLVELETRDLDFSLAGARAELDELAARLALLESGPRHQEIELAERRAEEAATRVRFRKLEHERAAASLASGLVPKQAVESAERELRVAEDGEAAARKSLEIVAAGARPEEVRAMRARYEAVQADVARLEDERKRTRIAAPIGGQLLTPHPERLVGRFAERGDSLLVLADLDTILLEIPVPEKEVADVAIGARVRFKPRSEPGRTFEGQVVAIAPATEVAARQRTVNVRSRIDNRSALLRAGATGYAKIYCGDRRLGTLLARRAVRTLRSEFWALW